MSFPGNAPGTTKITHQKRSAGWNAITYICVSGGLLTAIAANGAAEASQRDALMLYVRTAAGSFVSAATIIQLSPQRAGSDSEITSWVAICDGGRAVTLAPYYAVPGRIEAVLDHMPASSRTDGKIAREAFLPYP